MSQPLKINTFDQFIDFIENSNLTEKQIIQLIQETLFVFFLNDYKKTELIELLKDYWSKYGHLKQRPLFIGVE